MSDDVSSEKPQKGIRTVKHIILYGISIFFVLGGLLSSNESIPGPGWLLILLAGITLFPPLHWLLKKGGVPRIFYNLFLLVPASLVLFVVGVTIHQGNNPEYQE